MLVGENDHYKPLAVYAAAAAGGRRDRRAGVRAFHDASRSGLKTADDWRNDEAMAGGDAFFEEGIHWLHLAGSLGPRITAIQGYRPPAVRATGPTAAPRA